MAGEHVGPGRTGALFLRSFERGRQGSEPARGFTVIEALIVVACLGLLVMIAWPRLNLWMGAVRVRLAAGEVAGALETARMTSIRYQTKVAVKFQTASDGAVTMALYRDTDRDGVLRVDIESGVDVLTRRERRLSSFDRRIHFGFPYGEAPREIGDPRRRIQRLADPIRFNRSDMASFSHLGTATPGTVYLTDGLRSLMAVRVDSQSGMITVWSYDQDTEVWTTGV